MCGTTSEITSPSVRSTSRSTPCVLGCCGPMFTSISSVRTSNSMTVASGLAFVLRGSRTVDILLPQARPFGPAAKLSSANSVVFQGKLVILAQRMPFPIFRQQDPLLIGMAGEVHATEIEHFALEPIGGLPQARECRHVRQLPGHGAF